MKRHLLTFLVCGVSAGLVYLPSVARLHELQEKDRTLSRHLQQMVQQNHLLAEENEMLQHDPEHIEAVAREKLRVVKKNEIILRVIDEPVAGQ